MEKKKVLSWDERHPNGDLSYHTFLDRFENVSILHEVGTKVEPVSWVSLPTASGTGMVKDTSLGFRRKEFLFHALTSTHVTLGSYITPHPAMTVNSLLATEEEQI